MTKFWLDPRSKRQVHHATCGTLLSLLKTFPSVDSLEMICNENRTNCTHNEVYTMRECLVLSVYIQHHSQFKVQHICINLAAAKIGCSHKHGRLLSQNVALSSDPTKTKLHQTTHLYLHPYYTRPAVRLSWMDTKWFSALRWRAGRGAAQTTIWPSVYVPKCVHRTCWRKKRDTAVVRRVLETWIWRHHCSSNQGFILGARFIHSGTSRCG